MKDVVAAMLVCTFGLVPSGAVAGQDASVEQALRSTAGEAPAMKVDGAGLTATGSRIWSVEPIGGIDRNRPKLVLIGGLDGSRESTARVISVLRWWYGDAAAGGVRAAWQIAALPCASPPACDPGAPADAPVLPFTFPPSGGFFDGKSDPAPHSVWRWTTMQAPTVVVELRAGNGTSWQANGLAASLAPAASAADAGSLAAALAQASDGVAWSQPVAALRLTVSAGQEQAAVQGLLARAASLPSPLRRALLARIARGPLDVARLLAPKYPAQPIMSYIPALAWSGALRLAEVTGEARFREKPLADMTPFLVGAKPSIAEPYLLTSLAGHLAFADPAAARDAPTEALGLARKGADFILPGSPDEIVRFAREWTDDMFMATSVLARVHARTSDGRYASTAGTLLTTYAAELQRPDGLFIHAADGPHAWGRGNGFAAFGLMDALTYLPESWPGRGRVLESYRALMQGLSRHQAPDGLWREVVDEPGSYREFTVTAMIVTAMARGVRLGWLEEGYRPMVDRAWRGLLARIAEDGALMDVCTGTGAGAGKEYYINRAGLTGADDRGGAMGLTAAMEMAALTPP